MTETARLLERVAQEAQVGDLQAEADELDALTPEELERIDAESEPATIVVPSWAGALSWRGRQFVPLERRRVSDDLVITTLAESSYGPIPGTWGEPGE